MPCNPLPPPGTSRNASERNRKRGEKEGESNPDTAGAAKFNGLKKGEEQSAEFR